MKGAFATGELLEDARLESDIQRSLDQEDLWAWCCVKVIAEWREFRGLDCLGCCSYANETAFKEDGYYKDMCCQALADLNETIAGQFENMKCLIEGDK